MHIKPIYFALLLAAIFINAAGLNTPFFTDDPGLYASISKQMMYHHNWLSLYSYNHDWLDKPHFPFWAVLMSFKLFGIHVWSYKLPALLFFALGVLYMYAFAKKFYNVKVAAASVLILLTAQHAIMSNTDVRAEPYLIGLIMGSIYHISCLRERFNIFHLLVAAVFIAAAVMTKGIFVLIAIGGALLGQLIFTHSLRDLWNIRWLLLVLLTAIFITPELYALYTQFDLHPEKIVFGHQHTSGIKFFLWDSQFGRFLNSGPITRKSSSVFFFIHTLLWAYAPWCLVFYFALAKEIAAMVKGKKLPEYYTLSGGVLLLLLFSVSGFQLPFYTNILFPLFSIITANLFYQQLSEPATKYVKAVQWVYILLLMAAIFIINFYLVALPVWVPVLLGGCVLIAGLWLGKRFPPSYQVQNLMYLSGFAVIAANLYLLLFFYPLLTGYKMEVKAAAYLNSLPKAGKKVYVFENKDNVFQFYTNQPVQLIPVAETPKLSTDSNNYAYIHPGDLAYLHQHNISYTMVKAFDNYQHEGVLPKFIDPETRARVLEKVYLIKF